MAKLITIVAARPLQILGHEDTVEPGTVLATIETDCDLPGLLMHMQFGAAIVQPDEEATTDEPPADAPPKRPRRPAARTSTAPTAGTGTSGTSGTKSAQSTRRRR